MTSRPSVTDTSEHMRLNITRKREEKEGIKDKRKQRGCDVVLYILFVHLCIFESLFMFARMHTSVSERE